MSGLAIGRGGALRPPRRVQRRNRSAGEGKGPVEKASNKAETYGDELEEAFVRLCISASSVRVRRVAESSNPNAFSRINSACW